MRTKSWLTLAFVLTCIAPIAADKTADKHADAKAQVEFGIAVAQKGLWKEAAYRWKQATTLDPQYAAAWNDLAIACEQLGQFTAAREAYEMAMKLAPNDTTIRQNYDVFKEVYDRQKIRQNGK